MKKHKLIYRTFLLLLVMTACGKDFLEVEPTSLISSKQIAEIAEYNPAILNSMIDGLYFTMVDAGTGGTTRHNDFGQKGYDIWTDFQSGDMVLLNKIYGWYGDASDRTIFQDHTVTDLHYQFWRYYYRIIFAANNIIASVSDPDGSKAPEATQGKHNLGQALAMRAYSYYHLATYLSTSYEASSPLTPIYKHPDESQLPKKTQKEVFDLIISDLNKAITYLDDFTRSNKAVVDKDIAKALLAYTYAWIGDDESLKKAFDLSKAVIDSNRFPVLTAQQVVGGFNSVTVPGWMWGADITPETNLGLISWWGKIDIYSYSYAWAGDTKGISEALYKRIHTNDVRRTQFLNNPASWANWTPFNKFYSTSPKVVGGTSRIVTADYIFMRIDEMYMLHAEVAAKLGRTTEAKNALKEILANRFTDVADFAYVDDLTGTALKDEILFQIRLEFWGEGKAMTAIKRNKATVVFGTNHMDFPGASFSYNHPTMTFKIPENEILNNPNL
jgi:starch-binding outer membrane protein, SusD/RagB family